MIRSGFEQISPSLDNINDILSGSGLHPSLAAVTQSNLLVNQMAASALAGTHDSTQLALTDQSFGFSDINDVTEFSSSDALALIQNKKPSFDTMKEMERIVFFSNFPSDLDSDNIRIIFERHGVVEDVNLMTDIETSLSKGCGSVKMLDSYGADNACKAFNGQVMAHRVVTCRRGNAAIMSTPSKGQSSEVTQLPSSVSKVLTKNILNAIQLKRSRQMGSRPSEIVQLLCAVTPEDLYTNDAYDQFKQDIREEALKHGNVMEINIPRLQRDMIGKLTKAELTKMGLGKVFIVYETVLQARKAQFYMNGRRFDGTRTICAAFFPVKNYRDGIFNASD